jgi:glycosyltransferase involved in cell wall biosynthesis
VCIPAFNEAGIIADTISEAVSVLAYSPGRHEVIVVDDGSSDDTWHILTELAQRCNILRIIRHSENRGLPAAQKTLVDAAQGEFIFHIGADRQWRMTEIPRMLEKMEAGYDVVIGVRRNKQYTPWRKIVSSSFNWLVFLLWGKHFGDLGSVKLVRGKLWKSIPFASQSAFVHAQRMLIAYHNGAKFATVPVDHLDRTTGKSSFAGPSKALAAFVELVKFRFSPLSRLQLPDGWQRESAA